MPQHFHSYATGLALALLPFSTAQTYSSCNPTNSSQFPCAADAGLCQSTVFESDFTTGDNSSWNSLSGTVDYTSSGAEFTIAQRGDAPTIETDFYLFYGRVEVTMRSAPGTGIVSSIVLESNDLDEIDWVPIPSLPPPPPKANKEKRQEFLGGDDTLVHTNYFGKGNTTTYDREAAHAVTTPQSASHVYAIDWTATQITWSVDNATVRTLAYADAVGGANFPQTPSTVRLGIWAGGDEANSYWTRVWAGGNTTYSEDAGMPWTMVVEKVRVVNYNPAGSYNYTDTTGSSDSIALVGTTCAVAAAAGAGNGTATTANGTAVSTPGGAAAGTSTPTPTPSASYTNGGVARTSVGLGEIFFGGLLAAAVLL